MVVDSVDCLAGMRVALDIVLAGEGVCFCVVGVFELGYPCRLVRAELLLVQEESAVVC